MKPRDLANLLNRAAAAIETPKDLSLDDRSFLIEDLELTAETLRENTMKEATPYVLASSGLGVIVLGIALVNVLIGLGYL